MKLKNLEFLRIEKVHRLGMGDGSACVGALPLQNLEPAIRCPHRTSLNFFSSIFYNYLQLYVVLAGVPIVGQD